MDSMALRAPTPTGGHFGHAFFAILGATDGGGNCGGISYAATSRELVLETLETGARTEGRFLSHDCS